MVDEKIRRRVGFELGRWVRMADRQHWMLPLPPAPGLDREYDALTRVHQEAEDADDERRIELAIAIALLSRNYALTPVDYQAILDFGADDTARFTAQAAISEIVRHDLECRRVNRRPAQPQSSTQMLHTHFRTVRTSFRSYADRVYSAVAPWLTQLNGRP